MRLLPRCPSIGIMRCQRRRWHRGGHANWGPFPGRPDLIAHTWYGDGIR